MAVLNLIKKNKLDFSHKGRHNFSCTYLWFRGKLRLPPGQSLYKHVVDPERRVGTRNRAGRLRPAAGVILSGITSLIPMELETRRNFPARKKGTILLNIYAFRGNL